MLYTLYTIFKKMSIPVEKIFLPVEKQSVQAFACGNRSLFL